MCLPGGDLVPARVWGCLSNIRKYLLGSDQFRPASLFDRHLTLLEFHLALSGGSCSKSDCGGRFCATEHVELAVR